MFSILIYIQQLYAWLPPFILISLGCLLFLRPNVLIKKLFQIQSLKGEIKLFFLIA